MFDQLSERLQNVFATFGGPKKLTADNLSEALREVRRALLEADVNLKIIKGFLSRVQDQAEGQNIIKTVNPSQQLVKIVHDELVSLLGQHHQDLNLSTNPTVIMLFGLQGAGKTTSCAKLALKLKQDGKNPLMIAADVYRPAAIHQLVVLGKEIGVPVHQIPDSKDVQAIVESGLELGKTQNHDVILIDTAGRLQVDSNLMAELLLLERRFQPQEKLLVIDAMTGQEAVNVSQAFSTQLGLTGLIMTKTDGDARGGAALSVVEMTQTPIKFLGSSEKLDGLEPFHPERMATRILGMGDVVTLVEKAQQAIDVEEAKRLESKIRQQSFSFEDFLKLQKQLKMLGSLENILGMLPIPGLDKGMRETLAHGGEKQLKRMEAMIQSMTPQEREEPTLLTKNTRRLERIAKGCGIELGEIQQFINQFEQMTMMMTQMSRWQDKTLKQHASEDDPAGQTGGFHMMRKRKKKKSPDLGGGMPSGFPGFPGMPGLPGLPGNLPKGFPGKFPGK